MPGVVYNVQPQPWDPAATRWVDAGPLRLGVEYRDLDPASLAATYGGDADDMAEIKEHSPEGGFFDEGVSVHVVAVDDDHEYLRFDAFDDEPHYHYVAPTNDANNVVEYDRVANGPMLDWVLARLRSTELVGMLEHAGGRGVAASVDVGAAGHLAAVDEVERLARAAGKGGSDG